MNRPPSSSTSYRISLALLLAITVFTSGIVLASSGRYYAPADDANSGDRELLMMERFHAWMAAHGRSYPTAEEKLRRFHIYRENVEFIEATNRDTSKTYTCGENQFTDLTHEEFLARYTMAGYNSSVPPRSLSSSVITTRAGDISETDSGTTMEELEVDLPENVDWREMEAVTPVQDQLHGCNACWVFAAVATIESAHKIMTEHGKGELLKLSEQEIVDCTSDHCGGGQLEHVFQWAMRKGIATESDYGDYTAAVGTCHADKVLPAVWVKDYDFVPENNSYQLAVRVAKHPVAVLFDATDRGFQCYKGGIYYTGRPCNNKNGICYDYGKNESTGSPRIPGVQEKRRYHALAIIGYGKKEITGQKYWIAKNSWGTDWGVDGYVYIQKDLPDYPEGVGGLAIHPRYPVV